MSKNSNKAIKEVIDYLLELRADLAYEEVDRQKNWSEARIKAFVSDFLNTMEYILGNLGDKENITYGLDLSRLEDIDDKLIKLNTLLPMEERLPEVVYIEKQIIKVKQVLNQEEFIKKIQAKQFVSPKELAEIYPDMSISTQEVLRGRISKDKIPYHQRVKGGKITYDINEVKIWLENERDR